MKWFRHFSDAHTNEGISELRSKLGMEGVGMWWTLLEIIALKMDKSDRCHAEYSVSEWCSLLKVKQHKLSCFLELTDNQLGTKSTRSDNKLRIECRNLLKFKDEWSKKSVVTTESPTPQKQIQIQKQRTEVDTHSEDSIPRKRDKHPPDDRKEFAEAQVKIWNEQKVDGWPAVHFETLKPAARKNLIEALWTVAKEEDFDLPAILTSARGQSYLAGKLWFTLLWLTKVKDLDFNYRKVLSGNYGNGNGKNEHKPLDPEWEQQQRERESRPIVL